MYLINIVLLNDTLVDTVLIKIDLHIQYKGNKGTIKLRIQASVDKSRIQFKRIGSGILSTISIISLCKTISSLANSSDL